MNDTCMTNRRRLVASIGATAVMSVAAPSLLRAQSKRTIRLAHHLPIQSEQHAAAENFARKVAGASKGAITIQILPASQMGGQREIIESVSIGTLDMGFGESGLYANYVPEFGVVALPYLYRDFDHWKKTVDGEVGASLAASLEKTANIKIVNWMVTGYRYTYLRGKPITQPGDFKGLKVRLPEAPVFVKTFAALGAIPTPIPAPEMYAALQTGVVDAMEGTAEAAYTFKIYDVTKYLSMTRHILLDGSFAISNSLFAKLTKPEQELILKAAQDAAVEQRAQHFEREKAALAKLTGEGKMQVNEPDLKPFVDALASVQNDFATASKGMDVLGRIRKL
ncbi:TRAP transporter substrate-binding protein [Bosea sp. BK604]|uniref:TRAP transporter substrate-binding protein n=1 Tax=Bosea sp. BK604 TaxID=2512180 RepID=UPI00104EBAA1|nr:TRAP transporter substrate-binding protein [Bosea sp. BK604]TCR65509.1 tripartite ATP-independent transporter DctP family solute receptor [Bosea sp. BK604]